MPYPQDHFFAKLTFLYVMVSSSITEWNGLGLDHVGLCYALLAWTCLWFLLSDVCFSLICLKTTKSFSDEFSVEKFFPSFVKGSKYILLGTRLTENSNNSHSNLATCHLGWSQRCPMGGIELNFPHFFQHLKNTLYPSFLSQRAQPTPDSQPSIHLHNTLNVFFIQKNQFLVVI